MKPCLQPASLRRGLAAIWVVVVLAVVTILLTSVAWQTMASRRLLGQRQARLQASWLARAGVELAIDRLLHKAEPFPPETVELLEGAQVRIEAQTEKDKPDTFAITSEGHFTSEGRTVVQGLTRKVRREVAKDRVAIQVLP